jgi:hypothetical protein
MTNATRAGINLGQSLARSPTVSRSMSGGLRDARYLRDSTIADAVTAPAYTITARVLHWITAFLILGMIPWDPQSPSTTCTGRSGLCVPKTSSV